MTPTQLRSLSLAERLQMIEDLWGSIEDDAAQLPLPAWHRVEIDRRLEALEAGASVGEPWEIVRGRIADGR